MYRADFLVYGAAWLFLLIYLVLATLEAMRWSVMGVSFVDIAT